MEPSPQAQLAQLGEEAAQAAEQLAGMRPWTGPSPTEASPPSGQLSQVEPSAEPGEAASEPSSEPGRADPSQSGQPEPSMQAGQQPSQQGEPTPASTQQGPWNPQAASQPSEGAKTGGQSTADAPNEGPLVDFEVEKQPWFTRLPANLRQAIRANAQRRPPRGYEEKLQRYFRGADH